MRAVLLKSFSPPRLAVEDIAPPILKPGQVLVKIAAAPINPSDLIFLRNQYGIKKALPVVPGFEGSGTVIDAKGGLYARWLVGKRVACHAPEDGNGTWAEYIATGAGEVIPLRQETSLEQGASLLVNPLTAWALLRVAKEGTHPGFVQTAAASALGQMMERLARRWNLISINTVRRREQAELIKKAGAIHVLDTSVDG
jgi:NADPH:quinone reductase-like Zn-dependent oxidoreductase